MQSRRSRFARTAVLIVVILAFGALPALAQDTTETKMPPPFDTQIPANGTQSIPVYGMCLDYGLPFPSATLASKTLAADDVRQSLHYIAAKDYVTSEPLQSQIAVWYFTEGEKKVPIAYGPVAEEIIAYAKSDAPLPDVGAKGIPLHEAVDQGLITATISDFTDISPENSDFLGTGTLVLTNLTDKPLTILVPYGAEFKDTGKEGTQDMGLFVTAAAAPVVLPETGGSFGTLLMGPGLALLGAAGLAALAALRRSRA